MRTRRVVRLIPPLSNPIVKAGDSVEPATIIARSTRPAQQTVLPVAETLKVHTSIAPLMLKGVGDAVKQNELIARKPSFFMKTRMHAPVDGKLTAIYASLGLAVLEVPSIPLEIPSLVFGNVMEVTYNRSITIEVEGNFLWGALAWGNEARGTLAPYEALSGQASGDVFYYTSRPITAALLKEARHRSVSTLIGPTIDATVWQNLRTGQDAGAISVVALLGLGNSGLDVTLASQLQSYQSQVVALLLHQSTGMELVRPQLVFQQPDASTAGGTEDPLDRDLRVGSPALVLRPPLQGVTVQVEELLPNPERLPSGIRTLVARAAAPGHTSTLIPRLNLDPINE